MKEIKNNKTQRIHNFLKVSGITLFAILMMVSITGATSSANITFVTTGSSFSPIITVTGNPTIQWIFGDGSTSNSKSPTVSFGSAKARPNTLVVTPWSAVTKINIGYDGSDGGVTPSSSTIANLKQQNVIAVSGLENVAPYLQVWASDFNPITELDFSNFTALNTIECFSCKSLSTIRLHNVPSLTRLCIEESDISYLDLSEAPSLADLRGASQRSSTYTINWGTTGANIWHICVRDNPQITGTFPFSQFPLLKQFFNWNDNQSGTLHLISTNLMDIESSSNHYNDAVFSGCFPAGRDGSVDINNNNLLSLDISNDPGLLHLNVSFNLLNQSAVDGLLQTLDSYNTNGGSLDLTGNSAPSFMGIAHATNLTTRKWKVQISSKNNPPIANFTSSVTFGTIPLVVQFNDTSVNNPTTWLWDFGDGTYSTEEFPKHVYTSPGNYTVTLGVRNANGSDFKVVAITVLEQPVLPAANFSSNVAEGYVPLDVQFTDMSYNATGWNWNFGDGSNSTTQSPRHTYSTEGNYTVNLTVCNANGTASKQATITVQSESSSSGGSSHSSGGGGGGAGGSPEPQNNVEIKELSQAFITSGSSVKFDFPQKVTSVVTINFDSKKTVGKTTTIVETLKNKSTLVLGVPSDEVYKYLNIWVGSSGYATPDNIENAVVSFKVPKSWVQEKKIDKSSIALNRYSDKTWSQLPTSLSSEDDNYLYFTAKTPGFSPFAITGKSTVTGAAQPSLDKTQNPTVSATQKNTGNGNAAANTGQTPTQNESTSPSPNQSTNLPGFETVFGVAGLIAVFLYRKKMRVK